MFGGFVAVEHPSEIFVISSRPYGQRAVLKFAAYTGATPIAGRFTPGAFTNQIQVNSTFLFKFLSVIFELLLFEMIFFVRSSQSELL